MPRKKKIKGFRGSWGNGDIHGNFQYLLPVLRYMKYGGTKRQFTTLKRSFPNYIAENGDITDEGIEFRERISKIFWELI